MTTTRRRRRVMMRRRLARGEEFGQLVGRSAIRCEPATATAQRVAHGPCAMRTLALTMGR
jgi:hypothetical protein